MWIGKDDWKKLPCVAAMVDENFMKMMRSCTHRGHNSQSISDEIFVDSFAKMMPFRSIYVLKIEAHMQLRAAL